MLMSYKPITFVALTENMLQKVTPWKLELHLPLTFKLHQEKRFYKEKEPDYCEHIFKWEIHVCDYFSI